MSSSFCPSIYYNLLELLILKGQLIDSLVCLALFNRGVLPFIKLIAFAEQHLVSG